MNVLQLTNVIWRREDLRPPTQIRGLSGAFDRLDRLLPMAQYTGLPAQSHWNSNTECALCRSSEVDLLSYYSNLVLKMFGIPALVFVALAVRASRISACLRADGKVLGPELTFV